MIRTSPETAAALQPQIDKLTETRDRLREIQDAKNIGVTVDVAVAIRATLSPQDQALFDFLISQPAGQATIDTPFGPLQLGQYGGIYSPERGGQLVLLAEANNTDVVLSSANSPEENADLLTRSGVRVGAPQAQIHVPAPLAGVAPHSQQIDQSIRIDRIDASGQPDPTRIGIAVARRMRADLTSRS